VLVSFWVDGGTKEYKGYSTSISLSGLFVATSYLPNKGTRVRAEIADRSGTLSFEGIVTRVKQVPVTLRQIQQAGFALRFTQNAAAIRALLPDVDMVPPREGGAAVTTVKLTFDSAARFLDVFRREIRTGSILVNAPGTQAVGDSLILDLIPPASIGAPLRCTARVTQLGRGSVTVKPDDLEELISELKPYVERALRG
jgi:hypothetical protein